VRFYDEIAGSYDEITGAEQRLEPVREFLSELRRRHRIRSAVDAACGTGLHAVLLTAAGTVLLRRRGARASSG
jgi:predicted TPR repeat methyltransferase